MTLVDEAPTIAYVIQLATAPVFLLTAVSATLAVLAGRLARVVDRGRALKQGEAHPEHESLEGELTQIERRARFILWGLSLATSCGIFVSLLIGLAFVGYLYGFNVDGWLAALFIAAMVVFTGALLCLLREVTLAISSFSLTAFPRRPPE